MSKPLLPRLAAACGAYFSLTLFVAVGDGSGGFSPIRYFFAMTALTSFLPFVTYLSRVLHEAEGSNGWLAATAMITGAVGIAIKMVSGGPELAAHRQDASSGTLHDALINMGGAFTVISVFPLAMMCAAVAVVALRKAALPKWLGVFAALTALALAANGAAVDTNFMPALLVFMLWTLVTSIVLFRRASSTDRRRASVPVANADAQGT
jgi:hypothetical protein